MGIKTKRRCKNQSPGTRKNSDEEKQKKQGGKPKRLAPLDHIKSLYTGVSPVLQDGTKRKLFQKKDLQEAVRHMQQEERANTRSGLSTSKSLDSLAIAKSLKSAIKGNNSMEKKRSLPAIESPDSGSRVQIKTAKEILQETMNEQARRFNELKVEIEQKTKLLNGLTDELMEHKVENESLKKMENHETADTLRIDELEDYLSESLEELRQKQTRREQLLHMKKRLVINQVAFDAHIKGMEDALTASSREFEEVRLLMRQLEVGNSQAQDKLKNTIDDISKGKELRDKQMNLRRQEAENAKRMDDWRKQREKNRLELEAEFRGDLSQEQEQELLERLANSEKKDKALDQLNQRTAQKVTSYEEAFDVIRESTGVRTLDEMVDKFLGQGANKAALLEEKREAEERQSQLKEATAEAQQQFTELKAAGIGGNEMNREMYDRLDDSLLKTRQELKIKQATSSRLEKVLVQVRAGMQGLLQRLLPFNSVLGNDEDQAFDRTGIEAIDLTLLSELKLVKLLEIVSTAPAATGDSINDSSNRRATEVEQLQRQVSLEQYDLTGTRQAAHANNIRVQPRTNIGNPNIITPLSTPCSTVSGVSVIQSSKRRAIANEDDVSNSENEDEEKKIEEEEIIMDAVSVKKAAEHRYKKEMDRLKHQKKREAKMQQLQSKKNKSKSRQGAHSSKLAKPAKHQDVRKKNISFGDAPTLL